MVRGIQLQQKVIVVNPDKCTGCHSCEMACSMKHFEKNSPLLSRVRIIEFRDVNTFFPNLCQGCEDAPCMKVCPMGARIRLESGAVVTDEDACIGCRACLYICPTGAPQINPETNKIMTCDLCEGDQPWCVRACTMQGALLFVPRSMVSAQKGRDFAWKMKEEYKPQGIREIKKSEVGFG